MTLWLVCWTAWLVFIGLAKLRRLLLKYCFFCCCCFLLAKLGESKQNVFFYSHALTSWSAIVVLLHCWETFLMSGTGTYWTLFSWWLNWENLCPGRKNVSTFFVSEQQNLFVSCMAKLGNICFCNNVSVKCFPSLARPLWLLNKGQCYVF